MSLSLANRIACVSAIAGVIMPAMISVAIADETGRIRNNKMETMSPGERYTFIAGMVEGIAFHRYTVGDKDTAAMNCVYDWFYKGHNGQKTIDVIFAALGEYPDYPPVAVIAALANRKCAN